MTEREKTNPKIRLALTIAVPVMVIVITISMIGASFAWFSRSATPQIATIDLSVREVFNLTFTTDAPLDKDSLYHGETAISDDGYLIGNYSAYKKGYSSLSDNGYLNYVADKPYVFGSSINLSTNDRYIDLDINFNSIVISMDSVVTHAFGEPIGDETTIYYEDSVIPLSFTWYMQKADSDSNNIIYSPYGIIEYKVESEGDIPYTYAERINGIDADNVTLDEKETSATLIERKGLVDFFTDGVERYNIYVVFCPEKLYWMQYFKKDRDKKITDIYSESEINTIIGENGTINKHYSVFYSDQNNFLGSSFTFSANMNVLDIDWVRKVSEDTRG